MIGKNHIHEKFAKRFQNITNSLSNYIWGGSYYFVLLKGIKSRSKSCLLPTTNSWLSQLLSKIKNSTKRIASHLLEDGHALRISLEMEIGGTKIIWPHGICCLKQIGIQLRLLCPLYIYDLEMYTWSLKLD